MKRIGVFAVFTLLIMVVLLILTNHEAIWEAIIRFPIDWIISYLVGAFTMYLAHIPSKKQLKPKKKPEA